MSYRIGHGYDVHRTDPTRKMFIGGVRIECEFGLLGHSDADVLLHAVCDAVLGALTLGDIGKHFPDTSDKYKDIDSMILLRHTVGLMKEKGYELSNLDATVIAQKPKLAPYISEMILNISNAFETAEENVNVKATTEEKLGFTGDCSGIAAHAVVLLKKRL